MEYVKCAKAFKAIADSNRLFILSILQTGEKSGSCLLQEMQMGQPSLSHHMKLLCDANLVNARKEGKWTIYSLNKLGINELNKITRCLLTDEKMSFNPNPKPEHEDDADFY